MPLFECFILHQIIYKIIIFSCIDIASSTQRSYWRRGRNMVTISILSRYRGTTKYHASLYLPNLLHVKMLSSDLSSLKFYEY